MRQQELVFRSRGGKRRGAGRKPAGERATLRRIARPRVTAAHAMHVTIRVAPDVPSLRDAKLFQAVRAASLGTAERKLGFRIVQLSVQSNHLHLIVEADDKGELARGMQSFEIGIAKRVNAILNRRGPVFADRYHLVVIRSPRQMRAVLAYVLGNWKRHGADRKVHPSWMIDPCSSAYAFDGWAEDWMQLWPPDVEPCWLTVKAPSSWLLREGWRRGGPPISVFDRPGPPLDVAM